VGDGDSRSGTRVKYSIRVRFGQPEIYVTTLGGSVMIGTSWASKRCRFGVHHCLTKERLRVNVFWCSVV